VKRPLGREQKDEGHCSTDIAINRHDDQMLHLQTSMQTRKEVVRYFGKRKSANRQKATKKKSDIVYSRLNIKKPRRKNQDFNRAICA